MDRRPVINLFVDAGSPYSWLATEILLRYKERWGVRLILRPVAAGMLHRSSGSFVIGPAKGAWSWNDLFWNGRFMQVPLLERPSKHGTAEWNSLLLQRILTAIALEKGYESEELARCYSATWKAIFGTKHTEEWDLTSIPFCFQCCINGGFSLEESKLILEKATQSPTKEVLKVNTNVAVQRKAFGVPTMLVYLEGEDDVERQYRETKPDYLIFGSDRMEQLAFLLGRKWEEPVPPVSKL